MQPKSRKLQVQTNKRKHWEVINLEPGGGLVSKIYNDTILTTKARTVNFFSHGQF